MGLGNFLWKTAMNNVIRELNRRGFSTQLIDTGAASANEKFKIRVPNNGFTVDLYTRDGYWMFDKFEANGTPRNSNETVRDVMTFEEYLRANAAPHVVIETLLTTFVLWPQRN
ncbi:hypothetical protein [Arthrobacter sp. MMS18-M83]|uniref:hypothetical protein n=1 Tax=Arthrobacter sp. MMS18-M83 TaxID=2996261 RepID=UPI00227A5A66|nr:hypothetical protein [Arthrobacter sp. MMS18-M83]WAH99742.1 hypothetical protein OW521_24075 [Arthrobacter sp. MMS18-M83]